MVNTTVRVTNIPEGADQSAIHAFFSKCGPILTIKVMTKPPGVPASVCPHVLITFQTLDGAIRACQMSSQVFPANIDPNMSFCRVSMNREPKRRSELITPAFERMSEAEQRQVKGDYVYQRILQFISSGEAGALPEGLNTPQDAACYVTSVLIDKPLNIEAFDRIASSLPELKRETQEILKQARAQ